MNTVRMLDGPEVFDRAMRALLKLSGASFYRVPYGPGEEHVAVVDMPGRGHLAPLVMLHGFSASGPSQYTRLALRLRPHFRRILIPDLPAHGASSTPEPLVGDDLQRGLDAALDHALDPRASALIFASSMSGGLAIRYAAENASRVGALMLCSPGGAPLTDV
ncbi:MAG: alpha/beta fold hydrolase, partial [Myxococcota bacterium]